LAVVLWVGGCDHQPAVEPSGKTVKIGVIAPFSGTDRAKGTEGLKGIKAAMQLAPYLQNGDAVELVVEDDRDDPEQSVKALKKLVETDKVSAVLTISSSGPVLKMASVADNYKTPILALLATHPDVTRDNQFVSQLCFDDDFQGTVAALYVRDELLVDRVAVFVNPESAYSSHLAAQFEKKFESLGGRITDTITLSEDTKDYEDVLKRVRVKEPELVYLPIRAKAVIQMAQIREKMGWKPQAMVSDGLLTTVLTKYEEETGLVDGLLATDFYSYYAPLTAYGQKLKSVYEGTGTTYAMLGAEGYALLVDALNRCSDPDDRACTNSRIRSTFEFTGILGKISIGMDGKATRALFINAIRLGRMEFIVKVY